MKIISKFSRWIIIDVLVISVLFTHALVFGQASQGVDIDALIDKMREASDNLKTFKGALKVEEVSGEMPASSGIVITKGKDKLYWKYIQMGVENIVVQNETDFYFYTPALNQIGKQKVEVDSPLSYPSMQSLIVGFIGGLEGSNYKIEEVSIEKCPFYKIEVYGKTDPDNKWIYWISQKDWLIHKQETYLKDGPNLITKWEDIEINIDIPDSTFELTIP